MAQSELFEIVISAVNRAAPALANTSKSLDLVQQSVVGLNASMQQAVGGVQSNANSFRQVSLGIQQFQGRSREWAGNLRVSHAEATKFASNIGSSVITALTRLAGPIAAAAVSIAAFQKKLVSSKQLNELSRALALPKEIIKGLRRVGEEAGVPAEQIDTMLTDLVGKLQHMKFPANRGDFFDKLYQIEESRGLAIELAQTMEAADRGDISDAEAHKIAILKIQKFIKEYGDAYKESSLRVILGDGVGLAVDWAIFGRIPIDEFAKRISGLAGASNDLDADQVEKFWKAWREFSRALGNFTTAVLTPLLPKITEFITRLTNDPQLMKFVNDVFPQLCKQIENTYTALKDAMEDNPLDWNKIFSVNVLAKPFQDFFNQLKTRWQQVMAATPFGSQEALNAARKEELQYRKENMGPLSADEEQELMNLEAGKPGAAGPIILPKVSPDREKEIIRRMEEYRQKQRFTSAVGDDEAIRVEVENTRALRDLTDQVKELNRKFTLATGGGGGTEVIEGRQRGGSVHAGRSYLVGEIAPELFVPRQQGGLVVGARGPQLFTPAQSGAIVPEPLFRPWKRGDPVTGTHKGKPYPFLSAAATPLPPQTPGEKTYTGVSQGQGVGSYYGYHPAYGKDPSDPLGSNRLRVPEAYQGISLSTGKSGALGTSGQSLGQWHYVTDPNTGLTHVMQQTDVGPGVRTQKIVDIGAAKAVQLGYRNKAEFYAQQGRVERGQIAPWQVRPTGFGTYGRPGAEGRDITAPVVRNVDPTTTTQNIRQLDSGKLSDPRSLGGESGGFDVGGGAFSEGGRGELGESPTPSLLQGSQEGPMAGAGSMAARQEGGPVTSDVEIGDLKVESVANKTPLERRKLQKALEKTPKNMEWQLRIERALKGITGYSEFESATAPRNYGPGTGLPDPGYFKFLENEFEQKRGEQEEKNRGRYDPDVRGPSDWFNPGGKPLEHPVNLAPGSLNTIQNESPEFEATGSLNVNVRAPRGTSVKAEGTGPFETVNMTRKMTGDQQLGTS